MTSIIKYEEKQQQHQKNKKQKWGAARVKGGKMLRLKFQLQADS